MQHQHPGTMFQNFQFVFDVLILAILFAGGAVAQNTDLPYVLTIVGASLSGAAVLAYFRRDRDYREIAYKTLAAAICGLVCGAIIVQWRQVDQIAYIIGIYFFCSLLSLFFIRAAVNMTEQNASGLLITVVQRIFRTQPPPGYKVTPENTEAPGLATVQTDVIVEQTKKEN